MSLATIVPCDKFYNRLKQKKTKDHNSNKRFALFTWSSIFHSLKNHNSSKVFINYPFSCFLALIVLCLLMASTMAKV